MTSMITNMLNHLSDTAITAAFSGAIGYLCTRTVTEINSKAGIVCGVTSGTLIGLFMARGSNLSSTIIGLAALLIVPFKVCQRRELPITAKEAAAISATCLIITLIASYILQAAFDKMHPEG